MTEHEIATGLWYAYHGLIAFLVVLGVTAVLERYFGKDWPFE